jgi:hypothetical protein
MAGGTRPRNRIGRREWGGKTKGGTHTHREEGGAGVGVEGEDGRDNDGRESIGGDCGGWWI